MKRVVGRIQRPVKREGADLNLLLTLFSFGISVAATRLFLELTGYPQLGGGELHIAHVLWGGLMLFVAALLPLILANRWVYRLGGMLAGVGVGLFIDEVGKFITQSNDYFYPGAAPIIYAFFLITVLIYNQVRRPPRRSARAELYRALDGLQELLDHDLEPAEQRDLLERLDFVSKQGGHPNLARFAEVLKTYLRDESLQLAPRRRTKVDLWLIRLRLFEVRFLTFNRTRAALVGALLAAGSWGLNDLTVVFSAPRAASRVLELAELGLLVTGAQQLWFTAQLALQVLVAGSLIVSAVALTLGRYRLGVRLGLLGLLLALTTVNLLVFYFDQFSTIVKATIELAVFLGLRRFEARFLLSGRVDDRVEASA